MRMVIRAWVVALLIAGGASAAPPTVEEIDRLVTESLASWKAPGLAIAIVRDGEVVLTKGYGVRDSETRAPMTENTLVPIASMTKPFTSFSVALLVDDGKVDLDKPVVTYLPAFRLHDPAATAGVTLRDVLSHRTGLPRHDWMLDYNTDARAELLRRLPHLELSAPVRARFQYSNVMYAVAPLVVDAVSGRAWEAFMAERVFAALGMSRTGFLGDARLRDTDQIRGTYEVNGREVRVSFAETKALLGEFGNAAGGLYSTAKDLSRWMLVHTGADPIIRRATLAEMHRPQMLTPYGNEPHAVNTGYGLGWFTYVYRGTTMVDHGGNLPGTSTQLAVFPEHRLAITVLVNQDSSRLPDAILRTLADRYLGLAPIDWLGEALQERNAMQEGARATRATRENTRVQGTTPSHRLADYTGSYEHGGYGRLTIAEKAGALTGTYNGRTSPLRHWHYDVFEGTEADPNDVWHIRKVQFRMDRRGRIESADIVMEGSAAPIVFRRLPEAKFSDAAYLQRFAGEYDLDGEPVQITLAGSKLFWGGLELVPGLGGEFVHPRARYRAIRFIEDASGRVTGIQNIGNDGIVEGKRVTPAVPPAPR